MQVLIPNGNVLSNFNLKCCTSECYLTEYMFSSLWTNNSFEMCIVLHNFK
jgi:hypothetical protein